MRILVYPADASGCGFYRLIFAATHLQSLGHEILIQWPGKEAGFEIHIDGDTPVDFELPYDDVDVLVMQRVSHHWHVPVLSLMQKRGIAVVIDMDDNLSNIHRDNAAYWNYHPRNTASPFSWKNTEEICRNADLVTVSTKPLLNYYAKHGRGVILDNYVPERYLDIIPEYNERPVFGWAGTIQSHPADLQVCGRAIQELIDRGHRFKIIGPKEKVKEHLRLKQEPETTGVVTLPDWPQAVSSLDVGMAPLEISTFNSSKSRLKPLEMNSVGVPYVISPRQEYRKYHKDCGGAGLLAETPKEWINHIHTLMTDDILRKELSERGREYAATQTIELNSWRWMEAWAQAYENRKKKRS